MNRLSCIAIATALCGCDDIASDPSLEGNLAATVAYFAGAWDSDSFEAVQSRTHDVLTRGIVQAELDCTGIALGSGGATVAVKQYKASRLQDGSCNAKVDLFMALPPTPGLSQSSASELTQRQAADAEMCPVTSFSVGGVRFTTWVEGGVILVEGPGCTTTPGTTCSLAVTSPFASCSGDLDAF